MASRYLSEDGLQGVAEKSSTPESLYVDLPGDQRTRPIMCATEFSSTGIHKKKSTSFQITSVTVQGSRLSNDGGEDSADDLDESHTEDISSDILDCSKTTDLDNDPLSSDNSNANVDDLGVSVISKQFIPVKVLTNDPETFGASHIGVNPSLSVDNTVVDTDITLMANTSTAVPVVTTQVPMVNTLPEHSQHRFKVVKIVSTEPFKRARWLCMDFTDPPAIHGEQRVEPEIVDTTSVPSSFNVVPSDNPQSVAQFYEFPVNQPNISGIPQQQQLPQSVYGILLPVANNPGPPVTKVQNVGVQATPTIPVDLQAATMQIHPIATQSQATQATIPVPSVPLTQSQLVQVAASSAQNQTVLPTSLPQNAYVVSTQVSQPNQVLPKTQGMSPTQQQVISQQSQALPITQTAPRTQALPVIQPTPVLPITQPSQIITTQQTGASITNQGISAASTHVITGSQAAQGMSIPQPNHGLTITQANPGLPSTQGLSASVAQPVISGVQQLIPISQPSQMLPINQSVHGVGGLQHQSVAGLPIQPMGNLPIQSVTGVPIQSQNALPSVQDYPSQPNQGIPVSQLTQVLPVQSSHGLPITQTPQVLPGTQTNTALPITNQTITVNPALGLSATQSSSSLPSTQPSALPVLAVDSHPNSAIAITQPTTTDAFAPSQTASKTSPPVQQQQPQQQQQLQGSAKDAQAAALLASNPTPLLDILPDTLGTKNVPDGEEPESASSGTNTVAIDNKIEQAMDLVKSHLMFAVREEVDVLKEKITELMDRISQLEHENGILKANATPEMLNQLSSDQGGGGGLPSSSSQQPPSATHDHP